MAPCEVPILGKLGEGSRVVEGVNCLHSTRRTPANSARENRRSDEDAGETNTGSGDGDRPGGGGALACRSRDGTRRRYGMRQHHLQNAVAERQGLPQRVRRSEGAGVTCYISQARTGGWVSPWASTKTRRISRCPAGRWGRSASILRRCPTARKRSTEKTSIFFKKTRIYRIPDVSRNALIYLAISAKLIEGSPANSVSSVPIMPWPAKQ